MLCSLYHAVEDAIDMWEIALWFYAVMLCLNGMLAYAVPVIAEQFGVNPLSPFNLTMNVTATTQPNTGSEDNTSGLLYNVTGNVRNATDNSLIDQFLNLGGYLTGGVTAVINFLTGAFVWQALAVFGLPSAFVVIFQSVFFFFLVLTVIHVIRYGI